MSSSFSILCHPKKCGLAMKIGISLVGEKGSKREIPIGDLRITWEIFI